MPLCTLPTCQFCRCLSFQFYRDPATAKLPHGWETALEGTEMGDERQDLSLCNSSSSTCSSLPTSVGHVGDQDQTRAGCNQLQGYKHSR